MKIQDSGPTSKEYLLAGVTTFSEAIKWTHKLPYGENWDPADYTLIFKELCGTSATKHAALAALALEQRLKKTVLILGFTKEKPYLFLSTPKKNFDITYPKSDGLFKEPLLEEHILLPSEIGERHEMLIKLFFN